MAQTEHDAGQHYLQSKHEAETGTHGKAYAVTVGLSVEAAHTYGDSRSEPVVYHERELRDCEHHLMGRQSHRAEPAHHDHTQAERRRLHAHLQRDGPAEGIEPSHHAARPAQRHKPRTVATVASRARENHHEDHHHHYSREQGTYSRAQHSKLRKAHLAVYEQIVTEDVEHVSAEKNPHRHPCVGDAVSKLLEGIEEHDKQQGHYEHKEIGTYERQKLRGLTHAVHIEVDDEHKCRHHNSHHGV